jgi:hypothetical protein
MGNGGTHAGLFPPVVLEGDKRSACRSICFTCEDSPHLQALVNHSLAESFALNLYKKGLSQENINEFGTNKERFLDLVRLCLGHHQPPSAVS